MVNGWQVLLHGALGCRFCGHSQVAGMTCTNHWIPRPSFQTRLYHPALAGTPPEEGNWNHLGHSFQMPLCHGSAELAERPAPL